MLSLYKDFSFDAAHYLTKAPADHKCAQMHGHTYHVRLWIRGEINDNGWIMDFSEIKSKAASVIDRLDHQCLNNIEGLENPTCELLTMWLWNQIKPLLPKLYKINVQETPTSGVEYTEN